jgi:hypothetical protein
MAVPLYKHNLGREICNNGRKAKEIKRKIEGTIRALGKKIPPHVFV